MKKVELAIVALSHSVADTQNYAVVLGEMDGLRRLPVVIGGFEAQAIAVAMERMSPNRPLTHDLLRNVLVTFQADLKEVIISNLVDGIFYAKLICEKDSEITEIDSRTSDALAMAVRFGCPIYTYESILDAAGVILDEIDDDDPSEQQAEPPSSSASRRGTSLRTMSLEELHKNLNAVLEKEDYEQAALIRDEIQRRKEEAS
jgi:bifunctional DNase/RNase